MAKTNKTPEPSENSDKGPQAEQPVKAEEPATKEPEVSKDARMWGMLCHLAGLVPILGPLFVWLVKKDEDAFANEQGKQALNFGVSMLIYGVVLCLTIIGILFLPALGIVYVIFVAVAAVKASNGQSYRYPIAIRFIK